MPILHWLIQHASGFLNAVGIIGSLLFTGYSLHSEAKTRRVANLIALTESHRQVWAEMFRKPQLNRVLDAGADPTKQAVSDEEMIFVNLVIQHLSIVFHAMRDELTIPPEGLRRDVWWFFSLPIPQAVWERMKILQNDAFVAFVEECRNWK
ncbi:hypothetical protein LBMAG56_51100 [Verrucomicrobiota bacterium]|nr:hypothetical protein LBMAG56_51100 [Verrucomicrobiota bacterium]